VIKRRDGLPGGGAPLPIARPYRPDAETQELLRKRAWMFGMIEKARAKRRYPRLPEGHPLYDAEDLPHWWQRLLSEAVGGLVLAALMAAVYYIAYFVVWPQ